MVLLIDGYNLLHASGIIGRGSGPGGLERSRQALLGFLAASLDRDLRQRTTVVFDAKDSPPGLERITQYEDITVCYAAAHAEADDLIEELIRTCSAPRSLTVVSSDHRVQQAARRRRATAIDSRSWFEQVQRQRKTPPPRRPGESKPQAPLTAEQVRNWMREFGDMPSDRPECGRGSDDRTDPGHPDGDDKPLGEGADELAELFPPGYADDVLAEEGGSEPKQNEDN
jgi:predicted RNA-binding protein with PIN domain